MPQKQVVIIGSGFAGLAAASCLAQAGFDVTVLEKNDQPGGRARAFEAQGFTFDMGPSWYWMPEVFENFFALFGKRVEEYYQLQRLDPAYKMVFGKDDEVQIPANFQQLQQTFDQIEPGSGKRLPQFLEQARIKYQTGMDDMVFKPAHSITEFINWKTLKGAFSLDLFQSFDKHVRKYFNHPKLLRLMSFPILFLGASAQETPALYSLMNYADLKLGTWYPQGGMNKIVQAMVTLAQSLGVKFHYEQEVTRIEVVNGSARQVHTQTDSWECQAVVAAADYQHVESKLLMPAHRSYSNKYWDTRVFAPSSLLFYLGVNRSVPKLLHHNLFFDEDLDQHSIEIYQQPRWPSKPLYYVCAPSKTDPTVAPHNCENLFILIPVAPNLQDTPEIRQKYYNVVMDRLEKYTSTPLREHVVYQRSYAHNDFIADYHAYKGNAYGLANTLKQTAVLKPKIRSKKVNNLFFAGQLTVPGPGVPPSLISGQVVAKEIAKFAHN